MNVLGVLFAFLALFSWGFGDFLIQRATRRIGVWQSLFFIGIVGFLFLLPFVWEELPLLLHPTALALLVSLSAVTLITALFEFESLKIGKIAVVEPILGFELPLTVLLSIFFLGENLTWVHIVLMGVVFLGVGLVSRSRKIRGRLAWERGVLYAVIGTLGMSVVNVLQGVSSQEISPLITVWFVHSSLALACFIFLLFKKEVHTLKTDLLTHTRLVLGESFLDNLAWVSYSLAVVHLPIAITITITESYIILTVLLGLRFNHERLTRSQYVGVCITIAGLLLLAFTA